MTETCTSGSPCPAGFVCPTEATDETQDCLKCTAADCQTCTKDALATCTACQPEFFLDTDKCTACSPGCKTCSAAETCTVCNDSYVMDSSACKACPANCKTCNNDGETCTVCNEDFIFKGSQCSKDECDAETPCTTGKFCNILASGNRCDNCDTNCKSCTSADRCTACNHDYELNTDYTCSRDCNLINVNEACVSTKNVPCGGTEQQTACNCGTANNCFTCPVVQPPKPTPTNALTSSAAANQDPLKSVQAAQIMQTSHFLTVNAPPRPPKPAAPACQAMCLQKANVRNAKVTTLRQESSVSSHPRRPLLVVSLAGRSRSSLSQPWWLYAVWAIVFYCTSSRKLGSNN
ncbi:Cysteine-rich protein [Spironucleus salmonicida]|uniref:Cysteine-rich protein n=1 Tax=Spironucleus salmonicida TaxID=348837 RepID=V6LST2_9EUKA|nr:Cysteine-rich protein [Spironucleus salmonicida]KAH0571886.1 Cysteine-rich protein [Spironucleus salmonicida]|eukprot:EST46746.1 Cysteine-rich protein [Spironucleus salmonicida]